MIQPKMVRLSRVAKCYGRERFALRNVTFDLNKGEFAYITGSNGAGKTTLLKLLFAIERITEGSIMVASREISKLPSAKIPELRKEVSFVFQDFRLLPDLNNEENIRLPLEIHGISKKEANYRVEGVLSLVGLSDRKKDWPRNLSGGEQQRIAIARALVGKPSLLLADEPTGNLDPRTAREIMSLFREIQELGTTVLVATHDEQLISEFPSRVLELERGLLVSDRN